MEVCTLQYIVITNTIQHSYVTVVSENNYSKIDKVPQIMSILSLLIYYWLTQ